MTHSTSAQRWAPLLRTHWHSLHHHPSKVLLRWRGLSHYTSCRIFSSLARVETLDTCPSQHTVLLSLLCKVTVETKQDRPQSQRLRLFIDITAHLSLSFPIWTPAWLFILSPKGGGVTTWVWPPKRRGSRQPRGRMSDITVSL